MAGAPAVRNRGPWRFHHTLGACARSPELRRKYAGLQGQAIERITQGKGVMPSFQGQLTAAEIRAVAAFVSSSAR